MLVTLLPIVTLVRQLQPENAEYPMLVTPLGIIVLLHPFISVFEYVSIKALQLSRLSYSGFPLSTTILVSPLQPLNAPSPMLVTLLGITMLVRPLQPENAELPMLVTLLGIVTLIRPLQPENALPPMLVTLLGIVTLVRPLQP